MSNVEIFKSVIYKARENETKPKLSSLIKQWLGRDIPQSLCIRVGTYIEKLFVELSCLHSILIELEVYSGDRGVWHDNEFHQIDFLVLKDDVIYHREIKSNLDLDRGKKRDVLYREGVITEALKTKYPGKLINSCVFCPFIDTSRKVSGLNRVEGLTEFIDTFDVDITVEEFKKLGRNEQIHSALLN